MCYLIFSIFFFNDTATTEIYTLSLHDALPIWYGIHFSRSCARDALRSAARHARHPSVRAAALAVGDGRDAGRLRALRLPADRYPRVRGHGADHPHIGWRFRRRAEGDVHLHRSRRPLADAPSGSDRSDLPGLCPARSAPRGATPEALHDRSDVALRPPPARPLPRALAAVG